MPSSGTIDRSVSRNSSSNLVIEGGRMLSREWPFDVLLPTESYDQAEAVRAQMIKWLNVAGESRLWFDDYMRGQHFRAALKDVSNMEWIGTGWSCTLYFYIGPYRISNDEFTIAESITAEPQTKILDGGTPIRGSQRAHPKWTFLNNTGSAITTPVTLFCVTTNESITWQGTWPDTHYLRFDATDEMTVYVAATEGTLGDSGTDKISGVLPGSVWPTLEGEAPNTVTFTGFNGTSLSLSAHSEY